MPIEPVSIEASSERISPNMLPVSITSNCLGARTNCMAALSTYMCVSSMSGYSFATSLTTSRHRMLVSSTLALSTEHNRFARLRAMCETHMGDAADFRFAVFHGVVTLALAAAGLAPPARLAEVDVAGQFPQDHDVEPRHHVGLERRGIGKLLIQQRGAQVGEQAQFLAYSKQALLGAHRPRQPVVLRAANRAQQYRVR